jgi:cytochrome c2
MERLLTILFAFSLLLICSGCQGDKITPVYAVYTGGDAHHGRQLIEHYRCGACHTIPGIPDANGTVGPPLFFWGRRAYIAGELPNSPANLVRWIESPKAVEPGTAMPTLGLSEQEARDVSAYLYTIH